MNLKGRDFLTLLDYTPEEIAYLVDLAAVPFLLRILREQVEVIVRSFDKKDLIFAFSQLFENRLLLLRAIPYKTEISADDQGVPFFELLHLFGAKSLKIAVQISRQINHPDSPCQFYLILPHRPSFFQKEYELKMNNTGKFF